MMIGFSVAANPPAELMAEHGRMHIYGGVQKWYWAALPNAWNQGKPLRDQILVPSHIKSQDPQIPSITQSEIASLIEIGNTAYYVGKLYDAGVLVGFWSTKSVPDGINYTPQEPL